MCKACIKEKHQAYYEANKKPLLEINAAWHVKNREKSSAHKAKWAAANKEKVAAKNAAYATNNPEKVRAQKLAWHKNHPEKSRLISRTYQSAKRSRAVAWANKPAIRNIYSIAARLGWHVDHEIPLQGVDVCGLHVHNNLRIVRPLDNLKKGNRFEINSKETIL